MTGEAKPADVARLPASSSEIGIGEDAKAIVAYYRHHQSSEAGPCENGYYGRAHRDKTER